MIKMTINHKINSYSYRSTKINAKRNFLSKKPNQKNRSKIKVKKWRWKYNKANKL